MQGSFGLPSLAAIQLEETAEGLSLRRWRLTPRPPYNLA
jgi:hypothetical protein